MPDLAKIPLALADYQSRFESPSIGFIGLDRPRAVEAVVDALLPFGFRLANSDAVAAGNLAEHKVTFKIPERGITVNFGAEYFQFIKEGASWAAATEDMQILVAAEAALLNGTSVKISNCVLAVALHVQLLVKPREEVLAAFIPAPFRDWSGHRPMSYGNHLRWPDGDLLLDFSLGYANAIFVKFSCSFDGHPSVPDIFLKVRVTSFL